MTTSMRESLFGAWDQFNGRGEGGQILGEFRNAERQEKGSSVEGAEGEAPSAWGREAKTKVVKRKIQEPKPNPSSAKAMPNLNQSYTQEATPPCGPAPERQWPGLKSLSRTHETHGVR